MELDEIKQYSHKKKKIHITNKNKVSEYDTVIIKITLDDKKDNEIIRFSAEENSGWFMHQSKDDDYFIEIPNKRESVITIYAHYFPTVLYDFLEDQQIFSIYDFNELAETYPISQYHSQSYHIDGDGHAIIDENRELKNGNELYIDGKKYIIEYNGTNINGVTYYIRKDKLILDGYTYNKTINQDGYEYIVDDDRLVVRSLLNNSIDRFKNPNYKNYTKLINDNAQSNATEQGYFPLSSRYRGLRYTNAPDIKQNPLPYWQHNGGEPPRNCTRANESPYWEAKIHKSGLSPLIAEAQDNEYYPINVYLNYQYLPSSTEYHQHYFGFEPKNYDADDGRWINTPNSTFVVLDGENLTTINKAFGKESTYRIINQGNPFDDKHQVTIEHDKVIPINLQDAVPNKDENDDPTCSWDYNKCYGYYIYTPNGEGHVAIHVELEEDQPYKLQYFLYIPSESIVEDDSCTVHVEHRDEDGEIYAIDELNENIKELLLKQDKILRDQWIYHEIDFKAESDNRIIIKGAQHKKNDTIISTVDGQEYTKAEYELVNKDKVYFTNFRLVKMGQYSPTLKYNDTGLYLVEKDQWTMKSTSEQDDTCVNTPTKDINTNESLLPLWENKNSLPIPIKDVYFIFNDDFDILYDEVTSELSWTSGIEDCVFSFLPYDEYQNSEELKWQTNDNEISLLYDAVSNIIVNNNTQLSGKLKLYRKQKKVFTTGANNSFTLVLQDSHGNKVTDGIVQCDIVKTVAEDPRYEENINKRWSYPSVMSLGEVEPNQYGQVTYSNLNFKNLKPNDEEVTYFLRIIYRHPCVDKDVVEFKPLIFEKEHRNMKAYMYLNETAVLCASSEYQDHTYVLHETDPYSRSILSVEQLPLRIDTQIYNQLGNRLKDGYCELSINDKIIQSTIVDKNGVADFYIDFEDIYGNEDATNNNYNNITNQTIKIEYFNKYYESINYLFFDIVYNITGGYDTRPAIPIRLYSMSGDSLMILDKPAYQMKNNKELFMLNIDTEGLSGFSITVTTDSGETQKTNITDADNVFILTTSYNNKKTETYTIITDNIEPNDPNGKYRKNTRSFTLIWK